ncbi:MAG: phosphatidate cytidylyltransferase [Planktomarina sp.]
MTSDLTSLAGALLLVLIGLTLLSEFCMHWLGETESGRMFQNVNNRIKAWWVMAVLLLLAILLGSWGILLIFLFASFASLREFLTLTNTRVADTWALTAAFFFVLPLQYISVGLDWYGFYTVFIPVYAFLAMPILSALRGEPRRFLIRVAETQWSLMVCVFCISHVPALMNLNIEGYEGRNVFLIVFLVVVVQSTDTLQYVWGHFFGKHQIAPALSPSKTWEGLIIAVISASLIGAALFWITPFAFWQAAIMAGIVSMTGFFGGLVMSAIKRDRGIRDYGPMMMAQGGFSDRLDTVIFSAPIFFHLTRYFWGG